MPYPPWSRIGPEPSPTQRARRSLRARWFAAALSALVQLPGVAFSVARAWHAAGAGSELVPAATVAGLAAAALLLLPWRGPAVVAVALFAVSAIAFAPGPPLAALAVAFAVARAVFGGLGVWAWCTLAGMGVLGTVMIAARSEGAGIRLLIVTIVLCVVAGVSTGASARRDRFRASAREEASRRRSAAEEERLRIARELHDVLAHSLSQISVQAGVGLHLFDDDPERARESLRSIRDASTTALDDVRSVLGVLREHDDGDPPRGPGPTLAAIPALIAETERAGVSVTATGNVATAAWADGGEIPAAVHSAAYRIVQESLTNVRRHARVASAAVEVEASRNGVTIRVENPEDSAASGRPGDSRTPAEPSAQTIAGRGILGMRERAAALGGTLEAGRTPTGGFLVRAVLPIRAEKEPT